MKRIYPVGAHGHAPLQEILCQLGNLFPGNLLRSMNQAKPLTFMIFKQLQEFRQQLYEHLGTARDAVFDLMNAILVSTSCEFRKL